MVRFNNIAIGVRVTSGAVLLIVWMDLDALTASQLRKITRVLGFQRVPGRARRGAVLLIVWMDLDALTASQQRKSLNIPWVEARHPRTASML